MSLSHTQSWQGDKLTLNPFVSPNWPKTILFTPSGGDQVLVHTSFFRFQQSQIRQAASAEGSATAAARALVEVNADAPAFRRGSHQSKPCPFVLKQTTFPCLCLVFSFSGNEHISTVYGVIIKDVKNNFEKKKYRLFGYCTDSPPAFDMMTAVS